MTKKELQGENRSIRKGAEMITFEEVLSAWRNVEPDFKYRDKAVDKNGIRFIFPNGIIYEINTDSVILISTLQVYSNRKVFSMNVEQSLKAINLTVEYLKNTKIEGEKHD